MFTEYWVPWQKDMRLWLSAKSKIGSGFRFTSWMSEGLKFFSKEDCQNFIDALHQELIQKEEIPFTDNLIPIRGE